MSLVPDIVIYSPDQNFYAYFPRKSKYNLKEAVIQIELLVYLQKTYCPIRLLYALTSSSSFNSAASFISILTIHPFP